MIVIRPGMLLLCASAVLHGGTTANNLTITQPLLVDFNSAVGTVDARFTINWQNSWRVSTGPGNWDAAWVFLKFRVGTADPTRTGVSSTGTTLNVGNTALLRVGMPLVKTAGTGTLAANTVITAIPNGTQVTVNAAPTVALAGAAVRFIRIWEHARLASDAAHLAPVGSTIRTGLLNPGAAYSTTTNYGVGAFIYRSANGTGNFTANNVELRWNLGTQGLGIGSPVEVCAFAHEMVYVTAGSFRVGDGSGPSSYSFYTAPNQASAYLISSEAAITVGTASGNLYYHSPPGSDSGDQLGPIPAAFPKGTTPFYCMKFELTQSDIAEFFNRLTRQQQDTHALTNLAPGVTNVANRYVMTNTAVMGGRNGIRCNGTISSDDPVNFYCDLNMNGVGNELADGQWIACNVLVWNVFAAYLDWSGLRPMTELEYEKACRGPVMPVLGEYAWGTASIAGAQYTLANAGRSNEQIATNYATAVGNAAHVNTMSGGSAINGPLRVGSFAGHGSNTGRMTSGASYYGALELSGNLTEYVVPVGSSFGRAYTGAHGDGNLTAQGMQNAPAWLMYGFRGGDWASFFGDPRVSFRGWATGPTSYITIYQGGRGVRTMP